MNNMILNKNRYMKLFTFIVLLVTFGVNEVTADAKSTIRMSSKAELVVMLTMLIPLDHVQMFTQVLPAYDFVFEGDNRPVSSTVGVKGQSQPKSSTAMPFVADMDSSVFRIRQFVLVAPGNYKIRNIPLSGITSRFDATSSLVDSIECYRKICSDCSDYLWAVPIKAEGLCLSDEAKLDSEFKNADIGEDPSDDDNHLKEAAGKADIDSIRARTLKTDENLTKIKLTGDPGNSIVKWSPDFLVPSITWDIDITIEDIGEGKYKINVSGEHDGFPGYELSIKKPNDDFYLIYSYDPIPNSANPHNLAFPMDEDINEIKDLII